MTIAYFDCFNGASGDMIVGALLDAGADIEKLRQDLAKLPLKDVEIKTRAIMRQGISATKFDVVVQGKVEGPAEEILETPHEHTHDHHNLHSQEHHHSSAHSHHGQDHEHGNHGHRRHDHEHEHRTLGDVESILRHLPAAAQERAIAIFRRLAEAEAKVHGSTAPFVHFHEVGMDDAIVDVSATVLCLDQLEVTEVHCSPLPLGSGMIHCAHGMMPVPVPAVVELMAGYPSYDNGETGELLTPTGAAILTVLATRFGPPPAWSLRAVGYGGGNRSGQRIPNLLRIMLGTSIDSTPQAYTLVAPTSHK